MIGFYGGTFNPVHFGHLRTALEIKDSLKLEEIKFVPCSWPPHKADPSVSAQTRVRMLESAIQNEAGFSIDTRELTRNKPSFTVDSLTSFRREYPHKTFALVIGMDSFIGLPTWHSWKTLFDLAHVVVIFRPGTSPLFVEPLKSMIRQNQVLTADQLKTRSNGLIYFQKVTQLNISASEIRNLIRNQKSPRYLLPDVVWEMIRSKRLYQNEATSASNPK